MNILNKVWYASLPEVDADSFGFQYIISKLAQLLGTDLPTLVEPAPGTEMSVTGSPSYAPPTLIFTKGSETQEMGAIDVYFYPTVAYVYLANKFGMTPVAGIKIEIPKPPAPPQPPPVYDTDPVGPAIPNYPRYFYASAHADPKYWSIPPKNYNAPDGAIYIGQTLIFGGPGKCFYKLQ